MKKMANENVVGLIPAAGMGTRLGLPFPKELYPIVSKSEIKPIAQFTLSQMTKAGIGNIIFVINDQKHQIVEYFGDGGKFDCRISYVKQDLDYQSLSNSTSPGLTQALNSAYFSTRNKTVVFGMPDTLMYPDNAIGIAFNLFEPQDDILLMLFLTRKPEKFGMVRMDDRGEIQEIVDKPKFTDLTWMWGGIIWNPQFTELINYCITRRKTSDFATIINMAIKESMRVRGVKFQTGRFLDLGNIDDINDLSQWTKLKNVKCQSC